MNDTNPPQERGATDPKEDRKRQLLASLEWSVSRDAEIRDATLEVLYRFANLAPARPGETEPEARFRGLENSARFDDVRAAMLDALERS